MRRYLFDMTVTVICLALLGFFGWHAMHGKRSFANQEKMLVGISALEEKRDAIRAKRQALEARVTLLRPENIDPDMLEEMARRMLGFAHSDDLVVNN